jgi:hypothetical protein
MSIYYFYDNIHISSVKSCTIMFLNPTIDRLQFTFNCKQTFDHDCLDMYVIVLHKLKKPRAIDEALISDCCDALLCNNNMYHN